MQFIYSEVMLVTRDTDDDVISILSAIVYVVSIYMYKVCPDFVCVVRTEMLRYIRWKPGYRGRFRSEFGYMLERSPLMAHVSASIQRQRSFQIHVFSFFFFFI